MGASTFMTWLKVLLLISVIALLVACGDNGDADDTRTDEYCKESQYSNSRMWQDYCNTR